jgi:hypothetical protein
MLTQVTDTQTLRRYHIQKIGTMTIEVQQFPSNNNFKYLLMTILVKTYIVIFEETFN